MKIEFEGPNLTTLVQQAHNFASAFGEIALPIRDFLAGHPTLSVQENVTVQSLPKVSTLEPNGVAPQKRGPGRPPKSEKVQASPTVETSNDNLFDTEMVGTTGLEAVEPIQPPKKVTKEDLVVSLQQLCQKEDEAAGNKIAGPTKVREIFSRFGIQRLGQLDEKRYHEMQKLILEEMA